MPEEFEEYGGSKEYRYLGPPGTGKTFKANQIAEHGAGKFGADNVMLTSFSTAAAAVLAGRTKIPHQNIGTLHSMAYRSIGNPGMPSKKNLADWNEAYPEYFMGKLGSRDNEDDEETGGWDTSSPGNKYLEQRDRLLNLERPVSLWHHQIRLFHTKWEDFKQQCAVIDFHDMIAIALREVEYAPGRPAVIMADEAQDFTKPQANLIRKWGKHTEYFLLIGDDDQCIFAFRGATPDVLMYPELPPDRYKVLKQSFRVPREVHAFAVNWISQVKHRIPKEYFPRDADGCVEFRRKGSYTNTEWLMEETYQHTKEGRSVMFIVSCNYMLRTLLHDLRRAGLPYSNQYRPKATAWNPLRPGTELLDGVLSYLPGVPHSKAGGENVRPWTVDEIRKWGKCLKGMVRLWREKISNYSGESYADEKVLQMVIGDRYDELMQALEAAETDQGSPLAFFLKHLLAEHLKIPKGKPEDYVSKAEYLERILRYGNLNTLLERPLITVGTIHSVKGGQSDVVFLFPDVSQEQSDAAAYYDEDKDSQARVFYVAATRAREKLVILPPEDRGLSVPLHKYA